MSKRKLKVEKRPAKPEGAGTLSKYSDLTRKADQFADGAYNLLVIAGPPGVAKSTVFRQALERRVGPGGYCFIEANASPFGAYCKLWDNRNQLVVFDDADQINEQPAGKRLLKQIGQSEQWKRLSWESKAMTGKKAPAPTEFSTQSKVCIITNQWEFREGDIHTEAVEDRGQCYVFSPSGLEVHEYTASWFWDQEIFDFVAKHLPYLRRPTCRLYFKLAEQKKAGDDWRAYLLQHLYDEEDTEFRVVRLMNDPALASNDRRAKAFVANGWGSRATFYRYYADLSGRYGLDRVPAYRVKGSQPTDQPDPMAGLEPHEADDDPPDEDL